MGRLSGPTEAGVMEAGDSNGCGFAFCFLEDGISADVAAAWPSLLAAGSLFFSLSELLPLFFAFFFDRT
jgi:hypothetical protein